MRGFGQGFVVQAIVHQAHNLEDFSGGEGICSCPVRSVVRVSQVMLDGAGQSSGVLLFIDHAHVEDMLVGDVEWEWDAVQFFGHALQVEAGIEAAEVAFNQTVADDFGFACERWPILCHFVGYAVDCGAARGDGDAGVELPFLGVGLGVIGQVDFDGEGKDAVGLRVKACAFAIEEGQGAC